MKFTRTTFALSAAAATCLAPSIAVAWDEDTCGPSAYAHPVDDAGSPLCADPSPLQGNDPDIQFDHSTSHWEMTYLMARCVGLPDATAQLIAASDEAADMSSPYCGALAPNQAALNSDASAPGTMYLDGYACGYDLRDAGADADAAGSGAVPAYPSALRWKFTDRCNSGVSGKGHSEFFHYPYWQNAQKQPTLSSELAWSDGISATLIDPEARCDLGSSSSTCAFTMQSSYCKYSCADSGSCAPSTCPRVCPMASSASAWTWPLAGPVGGVQWPTATTEDYKRVGIYLHSLGDYYSHYTCQQYVGAVTGDGGVIAIPTGGSGPTTHTGYVAANACGKYPHESGGDAGAMTYEKCAAACALPQHDCEFGAAGSTPCSASQDGANVDSALRAQSQSGLSAVWDYLAKVAGKSTSDPGALAQKQIIVPHYVGLAYALQRQSYVKSLLAAQGTKKQPCMCTQGVYGWKADANGVSCCTEELLVGGVCPP